MATQSDFDSCEAKYKEVWLTLSNTERKYELKILYGELMSELEDDTKTLQQCLDILDAFE